MYIDYLTANAVSVFGDYSEVKSYINSPQGRVELNAECPPELVAEVLAVWGTRPPRPHAPPPEPEEPTPTAPTMEQRTAALEGAMLALLGGGTDV